MRSVWKWSWIFVEQGREHPILAVGRGNALRETGGHGGKCQHKKFSSTDEEFFCAGGIWALKSIGTEGTEGDPIATEILD